MSVVLAAAPPVCGFVGLFSHKYIIFHTNVSLFTDVSPGRQIDMFVSECVSVRGWLLVRERMCESSCLLRSPLCVHS